MDVKSIPTLADALKEYYDISELVKLCVSFDLKSDDLGFGFNDSRSAYLKFARTLITQIRHGNNRRFLEALVPGLTSRCRERIAHTQWERQEYHQQMLARLMPFVSELEEEEGVPAEITVPEEHPFTAKSKAREFMGNAETEVTVVDNYVGVATLDCLRDIQHPIKILTGARDNSIEADFQRALVDFRSEGYQIEVRRHRKLHDRYILFNDKCWLVGSSLKDAGKKTFSAIEMIDSKPVIVAEIQKKWDEAVEYEPQ